MKKRFFIPACMLAFWKKATCLNVLTLLLELGAVFFLIQSMLTVIPEGSSNWYLPLALVINYVALLLNATQQRKQQRRRQEFAEVSKQRKINH